MKQAPIFNLPDLACYGVFQAFVVDKNGKEIYAQAPKRNLILNSGMNALATNTYAACIAYCAAGVGGGVSQVDLDGTASQSGTTVTISGSTFIFGPLYVGDVLKFATGQEATITAILSSTSVTVDRTQTVAATVVRLYRTSVSALDTEIVRTTGTTSTTYPEFLLEDGTRSQASIPDIPNSRIMLRRTYDFPAETDSINYTEVGVSWQTTANSSLFSRVFLAGPVTVEAEQQLRIRYELYISIPNTGSNPVVEPTLEGWPYPYNIASISSTGSNFTVTLGANHHFLVGGKFRISGAKRPRFTITAASSTPSDFTLTTASAHGRSPGDTIIIEGVTPSGYNGEWTCAAGTTGSTIVVSTIANPGTGTVFGNVRQKEPTPWYDGEWTIASVTSNTVTITSAINPGTAGAEGIGRNTLECKFAHAVWNVAPLAGYGAPQSPDSLFNYVCNLVSPSSTGFLEGPTTNNKATTLMHATTTPSVPSFPQSAGWSMTGTGRTFSSSVTGVKQSYVDGNYYSDILFTFATGNANGTTIRALCLANTSASTPQAGAALAILFNEPQRKDSTHILRVYIRRTWSRILAAPTA